MTNERRDNGDALSQSLHPYPGQKQVNPHRQVGKGKLSRGAAKWASKSWRGRERGRGNTGKAMPRPPLITSMENRRKSLGRTEGKPSDARQKGWSPQSYLYKRREAKRGNLSSGKEKWSWRECVWGVQSSFETSAMRHQSLIQGSREKRTKFKRTLNASMIATGGTVNFWFPFLLPRPDKVRRGTLPCRVSKSRCYFAHRTFLDSLPQLRDVFFFLPPRPNQEAAKGGTRLPPHFLNSRVLGELSDTCVNCTRSIKGAMR